jgi:YgiT-type zinc finger domain-containing protein
MNCVCGARLEKISTEMSFFDGKVIVKDIEAHYCPNCKEEVFDSKQGDEIFENKFNFLNMISITMLFPVF